MSIKNYDEQQQIPELAKQTTTRTEAKNTNFQQTK